ncbi:MAG: SurA N-terminal domain-containing protein, partial [Kiritimatiellae bacterium]|nr:SurA N-terminal domain-containing protein [Kiritimatiellia bacterium]
MVIHQFNKLIRNKWVWGVFAVAISAFFAFDFLVADLNRDEPSKSSGAAGSLGGEAVDAALFTDLAEEIRGFGQQRDWKRDAGEVNRAAWENYAALQVAGAGGLEATDAEVQAMIRNDPSFQ